MTFPPHTGWPLSRREMLSRSGLGMASLGLGAMLADDGLVNLASAEGYANPMQSRMPQFPAKAKHVIHLFMNGGPSHVDTFDPKPLLQEHAGKDLPTENPQTERKTGVALASPFKFQKQ